MLAFCWKDDLKLGLSETSPPHMPHVVADVLIFERERKRKSTRVGERTGKLTE